MRRLRKTPWIGWLSMIAFAALGVLTLSAEVPEARAAARPITSCGQIVTTNAVLTQDLHCPGSDGIVIGHSGITIDLHGFTVRGDRAPGFYGINGVSRYDDVTVKNGVLRNFETGVWGIGNHFSTSNLVVSGNLFTGLVVEGDSASVTSSSAYGNGRYGIRVFGVSASIKSSTASGNAQTGVDIWGDSAKLRSAIASGNNGYGIRVQGTSASIKSSRTDGNSLDGILVAGEAASLKGNRANGNGFSIGSSSDLVGLGINVTGFSVAAPPVGANTAHGNDDTFECVPFWLC